MNSEIKQEVESLHSKLGKTIGMTKEDVDNSFEKFKDCEKCFDHKPISSFVYRSGTQRICKKCAGISEDPGYVNMSPAEAEKLLTRIMFDERNNLSIMGAAKLCHVMDFIKKLSVNSQNINKASLEVEEC